MFPQLYYLARVTATSLEGGYQVEFENGAQFLLPAKEVFKEGASVRRARAKSQEVREEEGGNISEEGEEVNTAPAKPKRVSKRVSRRSTGPAESESDEDITEKLIKVANSRKTSNISKTNGSAGKQRESAASARTELFSDDEELLSVSQRPSAAGSSVNTRALASVLGRASFSSTISRLLDRVISHRAEQNGGNTRTVINNSGCTASGSNGAEAAEPVEEVAVPEQNGKEEAAGEEAADAADAQENTEGGAEETPAVEVVDTAPAASPTVAQPSGGKPGTVRSLDEYSEDEEDAVGGAVGGAGGGAEQQTRMETVLALLFMILCPTILTSLHTICTADSK